MRPLHPLLGDGGDVTEPLRLQLEQPEVLRNLRCCEPPVPVAGPQAQPSLALRRARVLPGLHELTRQELQSSLPAREPWARTWSRALDFLAWPARTQDFSHAYLHVEESEAGAAHIEIALLARQPYGPGALAALAPFFSFGLDEIARVYGVQLMFWVKNFPAGTDFATLKRHRGLESGGMSSGIIRVPLHDWPL